MSAVDWFVTSAGILGLLGYIPQIITMVRTRRVEGLSIWWLLTGEVGWAVWLWYAVHLGNKNMIILYASGSVLQAMVLFLLLKIRYFPSGR